MLATFRISLLVPLLLLAATPARALTITIASADGEQDGFNDPTPALPVGRNPGTTLGEQRRYVYQYAADKWGLVLQGNVPIVVGAGFEGFGGSDAGGLLGFAQATTVHRDFPGAPRGHTWYVAPLANQFYGADQNDLVPDDCFVDLVDGACPEIHSRFNSDVDFGVFGDRVFYYGVDGNGGTVNLDFLSVVLHEMAHGLGIFSLIDVPTGHEFFGYDDAYTLHIKRPDRKPEEVSRMSDEQRQVTLVEDQKVVWSGTAAAAATSIFDKGVNEHGNVKMYTPATFRPASSVHHIDTHVEPNDLMEPFISTPGPHDLTLTVAMLDDIGWSTRPMPDCGDANTDGNSTTADALLVLKGAVGSAHCPAVICDVNVPGGVAASDALILLKRVVGQNVSLSCPAG
jgi:hypothetical protein